MNDSVLKSRCHRIELSLAEARAQGAQLDGGGALPETVEELEVAKQKLDPTSCDIVPFGLVAVWTKNPLRVNLFWNFSTEWE